MKLALPMLLAALSAGCASAKQGATKSAADADTLNRPPLGAQCDGAREQACTVDGLDRVAIVNDLQPCITLTPQQLLLVGSVEIGIFKLTRLKSIGECGCMSSSVEYQVTQKQDEPPGPLPPGVPALEPYRRVFGSVNLTPEADSVSLVVSPDRSLYGTEPLTLTVACKSPE